MRSDDLDHWARAHHGVITLEASGLTRAAWYRAIRSGSLIQLHPFVARLPGTASTAEQRILAATLAARGTAIASHRSAARLWGLARPATDPVDVIDTRARSQTRLDGVVVHRPTDRANLIPQRRSAIRCTSVPRTLADLGAVDPAAVIDLVGHVLAARLIAFPALAAIARTHGRSGRPGIPALRDAIDRWSIDAKPADSQLEAQMNRLITRFRLPAVEFHPIIDGFEVDFRVIGTVVVLECDGWQDHGLDREGFEYDRSRNTELTASGWAVVHFTYRAILTTPHIVADQIARAVAKWSAVAPPDAA